MSALSLLMIPIDQSQTPLQWPPASSLDKHRRLEVSFKSVERLFVECRVRRHQGNRIERTGIDYSLSESILGGHRCRGQHRPIGSYMPSGVTELVTGNTTTYRDFLAFDDFRIVCAPLCRETPERLGEAGQFKRGDCGRASWFFDVAVDRFRRAK